MNGVAPEHVDGQLVETQNELAVMIKDWLKSEKLTNTNYVIIKLATD